MSTLKGITISWPTGRSMTFTVGKKRKERVIVKCKGQHHIVYKQIENYGTICDQRNASCFHVSHHASMIRVSFHFLREEAINIHLQHFCFENQSIISRNSINGQCLLPQLQLQVQLSLPLPTMRICACSRLPPHPEYHEK